MKNKSLRNTLATGLVSLVLALGCEIKVGEKDPDQLPPDPEIITEDTTTPYSVAKVVVNNRTEYRVYTEGHHFLSIIQDNGAFVLRPHPGEDVNGWGTSWYSQPFLPGATLSHSTLETITLRDENTGFTASGKVSKGATGTYGDWNTAMNISYDHANHKISGTGTYNIYLDQTLSGQGDLNICKIASSYLKNVPLQSGGTGDTGDMEYAEITLDSGTSIWSPPLQPAHFPYDLTNNISIRLQGDYNEVDTLAQGHGFQIAAAYKPSFTVSYSSINAGIPMIFGGIYDISKSQDFWEDNIGITPLILQTATSTEYYFNVNLESESLSGG